MNERTKKTKPKAKQRFIGFRPSEQMQIRLSDLCSARKLTTTAVINHCLMVGLPELERQA